MTASPPDSKGNRSRSRGKTWQSSSFDRHDDSQVKESGSEKSSSSQSKGEGPDEFRIGEKTPRSSSGTSSRNNSYGESSNGSVASDVPDHSHQSFSSDKSQTSESGTSYQESTERHSNFWKKEIRLDSSKETLDFATKAERYSRYFLKRPESCEKFTELEVPYYYYTAEFFNNSSESTRIGSKDFNRSHLIEVNSIYEKSLAESDAGGKEERDFGIPTDEKCRGTDDEKAKRPFHKSILFWRGKRTSQIIAILSLITAIVVGTVTYTSIRAWHTFKRPPPDVIEILSPYSYPQLSAIRTSLIDPDTPRQFYHKESLVNGEKWNLVFSDEFNAEGRTFFEGEDQFFTAMDFHYAATNDLEYYVPDMIETKNGTLNIRLDEFPTNDLDYRSGMLQSWNQLCFNKKAIVEVSLQMPGSFDTKGLWPAVWSLGNLARPGFQATTDGVWPYTYDECDFGITPNQSSTDGISFLPGQKLSKCTCYGEEHPSIGSGRGAPEIDIIEGSHIPGEQWQFGVQTVQVAPFDPWWRPDYDYMAIEDHGTTFMKKDTGTPTQEAIASMLVMNSSWFENAENPLVFRNASHKSTFQTFGFEMMGETDDDTDSYLQFYAGDRKTVAIYGDALHPQGNVGWRQISKEPMSLIFNLGLSSTWSDIDFASIRFPVTFQIDYIRIYQPEDYTEMTCNPQDHPTTDYIERHMSAYTNANLSSWVEAGFSYPKNSLMHGCSAPYS